MTNDKRLTFALKLGLTRKQAAPLLRLKTPAKIQDYVNRIAINFELKGETNLSVAKVVEQRQAHCLEGAFLAACALWINGSKPLVMNLRAQNDDDHAVALFKRGKYWGAISKSNHVWLRWREPVYRTLRELSMSYFHEYVTGPTHTLWGYSKPLDLSKFDPALWVSPKKTCWDVAYALAKQPHYQLLPDSHLQQLRRRDKIEIKAGLLLEHKEPKGKDAYRFRYHW